MTEFSRLVLEISRGFDPCSQRHLDVTACGTAVWDKTSINEEQTKKAPDVGDIQKVFPMNEHYIKSRHAISVR